MKGTVSSIFRSSSRTVTLRGFVCHRPIEVDDADANQEFICWYLRSRPVIDCPPDETLMLFHFDKKKRKEKGLGVCRSIKALLSLKGCRAFVGERTKRWRNKGMSIELPVAKFTLSSSSSALTTVYAAAETQLSLSPETETSLLFKDSNLPSLVFSLTEIRTHITEKFRAWLEPDSREPFHVLRTIGAHSVTLKSFHDGLELKQGSTASNFLAKLGGSFRIVRVL